MSFGMKRNLRAMKKYKVNLNHQSLHSQSVLYLVSRGTGIAALLITAMTSERVRRINKSTQSFRLNNEFPGEGAGSASGQML